MEKRVLLLALFLFIVLATIVYAQDTLTQTAAGVGSNLNQVAGNLTGSFNDRTGDLLDRQVNLPELFKFILGSQETRVSLSWLVVLIGVFLLLFILIFSLLALVPFLNKGIIRLLSSLAISVLISLGGGTRLFTSIFLDFSNLLNFSKWGVLTTIIAVILIFFLVLFIFWITNKIRRSSKVLEAGLNGARAGAAIQLLNRRYNTEK